MSVKIVFLLVGSLVAVNSLYVQQPDQLNSSRGQGPSGFPSNGYSQQIQQKSSEEGQSQEQEQQNQKSFENQSQASNEDRSTSGQRRTSNEDRSTSGQRRTSSEDRSTPDQGQVSQENRSSPDQGQVSQENRSTSGQGQVSQENRSTSGQGQVSQEDRSTSGQNQVSQEDKSTPDQGQVRHGHTSVSRGRSGKRIYHSQGLIIQTPELLGGQNMKLKYPSSSSEEDLGQSRQIQIQKVEKLYHETTGNGGLGFDQSQQSSQKVMNFEAADHQNAIYKDM